MDNVDNVNNVEKPKKVKREITDKQRATLEKARATRQAKKLLGVSGKTATKSTTNDINTPNIQNPNIPNNNFMPIQYIPQPIHITNPNNNSDLIKLSDDIQFIKQHILEKKRLKEQKIKKNNSIDNETFDDETQKLKYLEQIQTIKSNFIR